MFFVVSRILMLAPGVAADGAVSDWSTRSPPTMTAYAPVLFVSLSSITPASASARAMMK